MTPRGCQAVVVAIPYRDRRPPSTKEASVNIGTTYGYCRRQRRLTVQPWPRIRRGF